MRFSPSKEELNTYKPKMPVIVCRGKSPQCIEKYIQTREYQPYLCLVCLEHYKLKEKFNKVIHLHYT